ncbi:MAG: hypothetical protein FWD31_06950 [Planctomycetaceae bacterium]|nr:hypothetical protein [Planctomycetaceae bacterium]
MKKFALSASVITLRSIPASIAFLFLVLVAGQSLTAQEKYTLKSGYAPGKYEKVIEDIYDETVELRGGKFTGRHTNKIYVTIDAAEKNADGTQKVVMEVTRTVATSEAGGVSVKYDSASGDAGDPDAAMMTANVNMLVGLKITTLYDQDGNPIKHEGGEEFYKKLLADPRFPKQGVEYSIGALRDESGQITAKAVDMVSVGVACAWDIMPKTPVAVGETWKTEGFLKFGIADRVKANVENTLTEVKTENGKKIAVIASIIAGGFKEPKPIIGQPGATFANVGFSADSVATVDIESGLMIKSTTDADMEWELRDRGINTKRTGKKKTTVTQTPK